MLAERCLLDRVHIASTKQRETTGSVVRPRETPCLAAGRFDRFSQVTETLDRPLQGRGRRFESVNAHGTKP
jgi:hypothetical protein